MVNDWDGLRRLGEKGSSDTRGMLLGISEIMQIRIGRIDRQEEIQFSIESNWRYFM